MTELRKKHPLAIRWFHWVNFPLLALMIWSGALIYWANAVYRVAAGKHTLLRMTLPQPVYNKLHMSYRLADGMSLHFFFMWLFAINGIAYVIYTIASGQWRYLVPNRHSFREAIHVTLYDLHLRRDPPPLRKYNGAQQIAYTAVVLMGLGSLLTGLAIYKPVQFAWLGALFGGYQMSRFSLPPRAWARTNGCARDRRSTAWSGRCGGCSRRTRGWRRLTSAVIV